MNPQRSNQTSDESGVSRVAPTSLADIELTNHLSEIIDTRRNEELESRLQINRDAAPLDVLARVLSLNSTASGLSSFTMSNQLGHPEAVGFRAIGFGQCGIIFERPGRGYVIKVARPYFEEALWNDLQVHAACYQAFERQQPRLEVRVPRVLSYVPRANRTWWDTHLPLFPPERTAFPLPSMALMTERILPLPKIARQALINTYCPAPSQLAASSEPTNRDCLARIYLGRRRPLIRPPLANFTLRNFSLFLDQMVELQFPIHEYAYAIGEALAVIHWSAHLDAFDVEFVLGSERESTWDSSIHLALGDIGEALSAMPPHTDIETLLAVNFKRRTTRLWVLDFNLCSTWQEKQALDEPDNLIEQLVHAFIENDPYYPRPLADLETDQELWRVFSSAYHKKATNILSVPGREARISELPQKFLDACVLKQRG
ncbi:hypothetical protein N7457_006549 [Penicillium paradoxum]|uniref:uncharacterized protein n=1 Tax=Penicillium paradoxum TaxID=176176 RepID=UPI002546ABF5|nr:uncharacterized protein N7457_006549 [Penicillium paradoxum]KAJ5778829.1 hypothetical protein N7457_006549 [Penicillium paradoxum]